MNKFIGFGIAVLGLVVLCIFVFYLLFYVVAATVEEQLPGPVQGAAWGWIQGTPQAVGSYRESDFPPGYMGQVIESGTYYWEPVYYSGLESFVCQVPVDGSYLTSGYGDARPGGYSHTGVDYGSNYQPEDIYAPMGGIVTHAGWSFWLGWTVVVENNVARSSWAICAAGSRARQVRPQESQPFKANQATSSRLDQSLDKLARRAIQTASTCTLKCVSVTPMGDVLIRTQAV